jgi:hypothetical protein
VRAQRRCRARRDGPARPRSIRRVRSAKSAKAFASVDGGFADPGRHGRCKYPAAEVTIMVVRVMRLAESTAMLAALWGAAFLVNGLVRVEAERRRRLTA